MNVLLLGRTQQPTEFRNVSVANGLNRLVRFIYSDDQPKKVSAGGRSSSTCCYQAREPESDMRASHFDDVTGLRKRVLHGT